MSVKAILAALALGLVLTSCTSAPPPSPGPGPADSPARTKAGPPPAERTASPCRADDFAPLMGTLAASIDRSILPPGTRVLGPDDMATTDLREDRLNIVFDRTGRVTAVGCG